MSDTNEGYFVINIVDGISFYQLTHEDLLKKLEEGYFGEDPCFLENVPSRYPDRCINLMENVGTMIIIIKGKLVKPGTFERVVKYSIE